MNVILTKAKSSASRTINVSNKVTVSSETSFMNETMDSITSQDEATKSLLNCNNNDNLNIPQLLNILDSKNSTIIQNNSLIATLNNRLKEKSILQVKINGSKSVAFSRVNDLTKSLEGTHKEIGELKKEIVELKIELANFRDKSCLESQDLSLANPGLHDLRLEYEGDIVKRDNKIKDLNI